MLPARAEGAAMTRRFNTASVAFIVFVATPCALVGVLALIGVML